MKQKTPFFERPTVLSVISSLLCVIVGLIIGTAVLYLINPAGAGAAVQSMLKNFMNYPSTDARLKYFGQTLVKTAPLLMCALSIQFCYKVGLFNIGAAGQYVIGAGASLFGALRLQLPWYLCLLLAILAGGIWGAIVGLLKAFRNVNEVISGIMLNWISLYLVNSLLTPAKELASNYTEKLAKINAKAILPSLGLGKLFSGDPYVTIAVPLVILIAVALWVIMNKTVFGYELRATGLNKDAAKYAGMKEKKNIVITLIIGGVLAALGGAFFYLTDLPQWSVTGSSVPGMGFNGIAATFLGALHPIGTIFASFFIQHITEGGAHIDNNIYPSQISDLISAIIIYLCAFALFFKFAIARRASAAANVRVSGKKDEKDETETKGGGDA